MFLRFKPGSPKGYRPKAGQIFLMRTTVGLIPVGVTSTEAFFGACVMIHPYRTVVHDAADTSYYPLIERNELLIPPVMVPKPDFSKGGYFIKNPNKNTPTPVPFDKYYYFVSGMVWNPHELSFAPARAPLPHDRLPDFKPINERKIRYFPHDSNPPAVVETDHAPEGTCFIVGQSIIHTNQLEFAIEDTLAYYGLINTPRPPHADFSDVETTTSQAERPTPMTAEQFLRLVDTEGSTSLLAYVEQAPEPVVEVITESGHEPNGYFFEGLATYLISQQDLDTSGIDPDSEAGMFCFYGDRAALDTLRNLMLDVVADPSKLAAVIEEAEASGHDFDD